MNTFMLRIIFTTILLSQLWFSACSQVPVTIQAGSNEFNQLIVKGEGVLLDGG